MRPPKIALCHEWATTYGGSEQVAADIAQALDVSDVFVFTAEPEMSRRLFGDRRVHVTRLGKTSIVRRRWQYFLPLMPFAWRSFDLREFDVVVTNSHCCTNSVRTPADTVRVSMCHTPMRYAWLWQLEIDRFPRAIRPLWPAAAWLLRKADLRWSRGVDHWYGNSRFSAARVAETYDVDAGVVYPPVNLDRWHTTESPTRDYFLFAGRLVAYKEPIKAVLAANEAGVDLVVAGDGPELDRLRQAAGPTVRFEVGPDHERLSWLYQNARALLLPGVEEFGITMIEAAASGTPGLALDVGGARDTIVDGVTGERYSDDSVAALADRMARFDVERFETEEIVAHAQRFSTAAFHARIREVVADAVRSSAPAERRAELSEWASTLTSRD